MCDSLIHLLGDQLSLNVSALTGASKKTDIILMTEVSEETLYAPHHKKKLVLVLSAMRHFAEELKQLGFNVEYVYLDDTNNTGNLTSELQRFISKHRPKKIIITEPSEYRVLSYYQNLKAHINVELEIREDDRFISNKREFENIFSNKKTYLMETFYRKMRQKTGLLMENNKPIGAKWNYDKDNRNPIPSNVKPPKIPYFTPDQITLDVISLIEKRFAQNFGDAFDFFFAVTKKEAEIAFDDFINNRLTNFGEYQDAMRDDLEFGFHSIISMYMNIGLLSAVECCKKVEQAYHNKKCNISSAEGFIRQVIGWREYIRGIYWLKMPEYKTLNFFNNTRKLPSFYWDENKTEMQCLKSAIKQTRVHAYSHHIQRLMITGNFAMLIGVSPDELDEWYMGVYIDAFEWVEMPNTRGMASYADGGIVGTKPYAASGKYINRMSNFCDNCKYDPNKVIGENACPFNYLYWNFIINHKEKLEGNHRMLYSYLTLKKKSDKEIAAIKNAADIFLNTL
ncbi:MAG: cryptochrome/photolyase family protein [Alphaproteobacteria bacterium]|jgi:deoxyribodipyrimidine photolyase-related protein|nr:cryptochrome/photolyase family protein [Candidatus Jidaibacter sp.]